MRHSHRKGATHGRSSASLTGESESGVGYPPPHSGTIPRGIAPFLGTPRASCVALSTPTVPRAAEFTPRLCRSGIFYHQQSEMPNLTPKPALPHTRCAHRNGPGTGRERKKGRRRERFRGESTNAGEGPTSPGVRDHARRRRTVSGRDRPTGRDDRADVHLRSTPRPSARTGGPIRPARRVRGAARLLRTWKQKEERVPDGRYITHGSGRHRCSAP